MAIGFRPLPLAGSAAATPAPNGWMGALSRAPRSVALPVAAALTWCPQPITPAVAATPSLGWQGPLSVAPPIVKAASSFSFVPFNTVQPSNSRTGLPWQAPLSKAAPPPPVWPAYSFVPLNTVQPSNSRTGMPWQQPLSKSAAQPPLRPAYNFFPFNTAATITTGWQSPLSIAPRLPNAPFSQPQLVLPGNPQVFLGWFQPLSVAVKAVVQPRTNLSFVVPPFVVPSGWQSQLSVAPALAKAPQSFAFVPYLSLAAATTTTLSASPGSYIVTGNAANLCRDFVNWLPGTIQAETWTARTIDAEAWTPKVLQSETWTAKVAQVEAWTSATKQDETWTEEEPQGNTGEECS